MNRFYAALIIPYDARVAMEAACIYQLPDTQEVIRELEASENKSKTDIYDDVKIIASAKVFKLAEFYSDDRNLRRIAKAAGVNALPLPSQGSLFDT